MSRTSKPVPLCCVSIGYQALLMPADKGMKLVELLQGAVECDRRYEGHGPTYYLREQPDVEYVAVKPQQVRAPRADASPSAIEATTVGGLKGLLK